VFLPFTQVFLGLFLYSTVVVCCPRFLSFVLKIKNLTFRRSGKTLKAQKKVDNDKKGIALALYGLEKEKIPFVI